MIATLEFTIGLKMLWADFTFPPINLHTFPIQQEYIRRNADRAISRYIPKSKSNRKFSLEDIGIFYKSRSKN